MVAFPHWFPAILFAAMAAAVVPKRCWRFTTRGLLVFTTLVALALWFGVSMY
jgi:hypothetical protein